MNKELAVFSNTEFGSIQVLEEDGKVLFNASEVAKALGYSNDRDAISKHCRCVVKRDVPHPQSPTKTIKMNFIPEPDLYRLICGSRLESAQRFERWVFEEVLPSIRNKQQPQTPHKVDGLQVFSFEKRDVRVAMKDGEPWWVAKDVCDVLGYENSRKALADHIDEGEKGVTKCDTLGGMQEMSIINESGLYALVMRSSKPEAKRFRKWVTSEVLPSIRKHGAYLTPAKLEEVLLNPDTIIKLAQALKDEQEKRAVLEAQAKVDRPKVLFADAVSESKTSILIGNMAKLLKQNNVDIGQNRLFRWLRENGYLIKRQGPSYNMPTQAAMEKELFEVAERVYNLPDGSTRITRTVKVTGKGQVHLANKFIGSKAVEAAA